MRDTLANLLEYLITEDKKEHPMKHPGVLLETIKKLLQNRKENG